MDVDWVKVCASIHSSRAEVFAALTDRRAFPRWWAAGWSGCSIVACEITAVNDGEFRIDSQTKRGAQHFWRGRFLHVSEDLLYFTLDTDRSRNAASTVMIGLRPQDDRTEVTVEHSGLCVEEERSIMRTGWNQLLAVFDRGMRRLGAKHINAELERFREGRDPTDGGDSCR